MDEPGFLRCEVSVTVHGRNYQGIGTAGISPEAIRSAQVDPPDFDSFWEKAKADLAEVPLEPEITHLPDRSTSKLDFYHVGIRNLGREGSRVYGILCVPKGDGPFPAMLQVPDAGTGPQHGWSRLAERGVITLQIGIHGLPHNLAPKAHQSFGTAGIDGDFSGYPTIRLDDRGQYYFRRAYLDCLRTTFWYRTQNGTARTWS